jgi:hypothetical protein
VEKGKLSSSDVRNGLLDTIEFIDSLVCDAPKAYEYLGDMLCAMFLVKVNYLVKYNDKVIDVD